MNGAMLLEALKELEREKGISVDESIEILSKALMSAYKKYSESERNVEILINRQSGEIEVYQLLEVVDKVENLNLQISLEDALKIKSGVNVGDVIKKKINIKSLGRYAIQTAKQVLIQKVREIEKERQFEKYNELVGKIVTAEVLKVTSEWLDIRIGKLETHLPAKEWIPSEIFEQSELIKVYVVHVEKGKKGPKIIVSRAVPEFVEKLLALEVPEIEEGFVEIVRIAREPGVRTKVAVQSKDVRVDPIGACIGPDGARIASILRELKGEKLDIIKWSQDPKELIANALMPATVLEVDILSESEKSARVLVSPTQLSLAIGKGGQNARLAVKLTGWKIDIKPVMNA